MTRLVVLSRPLFVEGFTRSSSWMVREVMVSMSKSWIELIGTIYDCKMLGDCGEGEGGTGELLARLRDSDS